MKTYKEAIRPPVNGYKYSNELQQTAQLSEMIGAKHCLRKETIFEWANKNAINLLYYMPVLMSKEKLLEANTALLEDILNEKFDAVKKLKL